MCTTVVGWIDSARNVQGQQTSLQEEGDVPKNTDPRPTLDALLDAPIFPDSKLKFLQKLSAELMSYS